MRVEALHFQLLLFGIYKMFNASAMKDAVRTQPNVENSRGESMENPRQRSIKGKT